MKKEKLGLIVYDFLRLDGLNELAFYHNDIFSLIYYQDDEDLPELSTLPNYFIKYFVTNFTYLGSKEWGDLSDQLDCLNDKLRFFPYIGPFRSFEELEQSVRSIGKVLEIDTECLVPLDKYNQMVEDSNTGPNLVAKIRQNAQTRETEKARSFKFIDRIFGP